MCSSLDYDIALNRTCLCVYKRSISFSLSHPLICLFFFAARVLRYSARCISRDFRTRISLGSFDFFAREIFGEIFILNFDRRYRIDAILRCNPRLAHSYDNGISIRTELARQLRINRAKGANRDSIGTSSTMNS